MSRTNCWAVRPRASRLWRDGECGEPSALVEAGGFKKEAGGVHCVLADSVAEESRVFRFGGLGLTENEVTGFDGTGSVFISEMILQ